MIHQEDIPLVSTIKERCRVCYTCVRECPAKAIRIADGQAEVIPGRCIGCGNCVRVCSQNAKQVLDSVDRVRALLAGTDPVAACVAPSFPAEFIEYPYRRFVGMVRALGFDHVNEVAFGADLVADRYRRLLERDREKRYIATSCPAVVAFVERYHPDLVDSLAPIVSPMVAVARALHELHGENLKIVFVGPCVAKKGEAASINLPEEVDAALTFIELERMFEEAELDAGTVEASDFDPPHAGAGALFAISRGLLQAASIDEDLMTGEVVAADGRSGFVEAIKEFESGDLDARLLEILACNGCIMGPGTSCKAPLFSRRSRVSQHVRRTMAARDADACRAQMERLVDLDLSRTFTANDQRIPVPFGDEIEQIMARMGKFRPEDELNCGACGYDTCREHAVAIFKGLAENEMCLPHTIERLGQTVRELAVSHEQLASAQEALMQSEKLASMGQLAAGIAHEVNNPLGVVLMYAHLLLEEAPGESEMREDLGTLAREADRCKKIVSGLLNFARQTRVVLQPADIAELAGKCMLALQAPDSVTVNVERSGEDTVAEVDADQITQVLTNLVTNAFAAMSDDGGDVTVRVEGGDEDVRLVVADSGHGIPQENLNKIFEPFFTTKQMGKGTGLGLAVTYGIVKMHRGDVSVESNADPDAGPTGTTFTVSLPRNAKQD